MSTTEEGCDLACFQELWWDCFTSTSLRHFLQVGHLKKTSPLETKLSDTAAAPQANRPRYASQPVNNFVSFFSRRAQGLLETRGLLHHFLQIILVLKLCSLAGGWHELTPNLRLMANHQWQLDNHQCPWKDLLMVPHRHSLILPQDQSPCTI